MFDQIWCLHRVLLSSTDTTSVDQWQSDLDQSISNELADNETCDGSETSSEDEKEFVESVKQLEHLKQQIIADYSWIHIYQSIWLSFPMRIDSYWLLLLVPYSKCLFSTHLFTIVLTKRLPIDVSWDCLVFLRSINKDSSSFIFVFIV